MAPRAKITFKSKKEQCKQYTNGLYLRGIYVPKVSMNCLACSKAVKYKLISDAQTLGFVEPNPLKMVNILYINTFVLQIKNIYY
jgi:hypothetical protein